MGNSFNYENKNRKDFPYYKYIQWEVKIDGFTITGEGETVRQAIRRARKAVRRHRRMQRFLNRD